MLLLIMLYKAFKPFAVSAGPRKKEKGKTTEEKQTVTTVTSLFQEGFLAFKHFLDKTITSRL